MAGTAPAVLRWAREIVDVAARYGLPSELVASIVHKESTGDPRATKYEPAYRWLVTRGGVIVPPAGVSVEDERRQQMTSWGLMQVMGAVLREQGCELPRLEAILDDPRAQLVAGCRYLSALAKRWGERGRYISAYNAGHPKPPGSDQWIAYVEPVLARIPAYRVALVTGEP